MCFLFFAIAIARTVPPPASDRLRAAGGLVVVALGFSFVSLSVHYLSDVTAGWALGVIAFTLCSFLAAVFGQRLGLKAKLSR